MSLMALLIESTVKASLVMLAALVAVACLRRRVGGAAALDPLGRDRRGHGCAAARARSCRRGTSRSTPSRGRG